MAAPHEREPCPAGDVSRGSSGGFSAEKSGAASVSAAPPASGGTGGVPPSHEEKDKAADAEQGDATEQSQSRAANPRGGPPPLLAKPAPRLSDLPSSLFSPEQKAKVEELRRRIDDLAIEAETSVSASSSVAQENGGTSADAVAQKQAPERTKSSSWFSWKSAISFSSTAKEDEKKNMPQEVTTLQWEELLWVDDDLLLSRYLRSYGWNVAEAHKQLLRTLAWRRQRKPQSICPADVIDVAQKGSIYRRGFDAAGRAMVYFKPGRDPGTSSASSQQHILYTVERAIQSLDRMQGRDQLVFLIDFNGWGISQIPNTDVSMEIVSILNDHYTDVLAEAYIVDAPSYFDAVWRLVSLMVHPETAKKVLFLSSRNPDHVEELRRKIPPGYLESCIGGECELDYEHDAYWEEEQKQFAAFADARREALQRLKSEERLQRRVRRCQGDTERSVEEAEAGEREA
uniref:CRAL/TRIO domain-containing protein n=1 Tax=Toxoplasma gondii COUG TaxID=1074873 RepID=A0A2G8XX77_TOXGO|nr:CRAL/TRIO domain-containing protein [Toxoplasma gondii COUG]